MIVTESRPRPILSPYASPPPAAPVAAEPLDQVRITSPVVEPPGPSVAVALVASLALLGAVGPLLQELPPWEVTHSHSHGRTTHGPHGNWDRQYNPGGGWHIPRNDSPVRVTPGFRYEVPLGTQDLGPVHILDNTRGRIRALRLQWPEESDARARGPHEAVFRELFTRLPHDVRFEVVAERSAGADLQRLIQQWGIKNPERIRIHDMSLRSTRERYYISMSIWSRDSSVTLTRAADGREIVLVPRGFRNDGQRDEYLNRVIDHGGGQAPAFLGQHGVVVRRSTLDFEGGDLVANGRHLLVSGATIEDNMRTLGLSREAVVDRFQQEFGRAVLVIEPEPDFHIDMGINFLDDGTVAVADPTLADQLLGQTTNPHIETMRQVTREKDLDRKLDAAATFLGQQGYRVVRFPGYAGRALSSPYLTYQNVLMERYDNVRRVYMPVYGIGVLDQAARATYQREGFEVVDMPSAAQSTLLQGGIRCAVGEIDILN